MSTRPFDPIDEALAGDSSPHDVLDVVDDAIEEATKSGDTAALSELADRLDAVAAERGGEWRKLAIAAMRAGALAGVAAAEPAPQPEIDEPPVPSDEVAVRYAGWWIRTAAFLLDWVLLAVAYGLLATITADGSGGAVLVFVWLALPLAYFAGMHAANDGATAGKAVCKVAVRGPNGRRIGLGRAIGRAVATSVLWVTVFGGLIDATSLGTDRRKQALHDKIAGTVVVRSGGAPPAAVRN